MTDTIKNASFEPVTPGRWGDLEKLFGPRGCSGCWCMWWRLRRSDFYKLSAQARKNRFHKLVESGSVPGILAYVDGEPAGWCSIAPRQTYAALEHSRNFKPVDSLPVWSVTCFFIAKQHRHAGLMDRLLNAAVEYARQSGAAIVEGYPAREREQPSDANLYMGPLSVFRAAGFQTVREEPRVIVRRTVA